jgi:hypothetical protein
MREMQDDIENEDFYLEESLSNNDLNNQNISYNFQGDVPSIDTV